MNRRELLIILGMAAVTFSVRDSFFVLGHRVAFPAWARRALAYVPVAVLTAIVAPMVLLPDGAHWQLTWRNAWLAGALVSGIMAWKRLPILAAIATSMGVYFLWRVVAA
ncbi:MAG TPA: AzlD domain-containing protein [Holophaga sp.]|nr:AzlD domain-containing protein [Holophaga sp.]